MRNLNQYDIRYTNSILNWDEALPLGNGKMGCLLYGGGPLRFSLDRVDLWDSRPCPTTLEKGFTFKNLVKLVKSGKEEDWREYCRLFDDIFMKKPYPSKITAGRLELDFGKKTEKLLSRVDIRKATATVCDPEGEFAVETFLSAVNYIGVARVKGEYSLEIRLPEYISATETERGLEYPKAQVIRDGDFLYYEQTTFTDFRYGIVVLERKKEGYSEVYFTLVTSAEAEDFIAKGKADLLKAEGQGFDEMKKAHTAWWKRYWAKSEISVPDKLLEKTYYRSWYLFASCSRKGFYPMPLQGVWTADNGQLPPWKGDYHHDTNTELSYQSYLKANRLDEGRVFVDYLWSLKGAFEKFAKNFYGVKGLLLPSCSTLDGKAMGGWAHYSLSPTMTIWAAQSFDEYYLYTGNVQFLKTRAYPFLKGVGKAIKGLLEEKDGKLYLPLSSSPEIFDAEPKAYLKPNSNFDLALMRYLYKTLDGYAKILGTGETEYAEILSKLDEIAIFDESIVMLDSTQKLEETHRHFSHLMCLYPLHLINYDTPANKRIYEGSLLEIERLGMGMWVGFSYAMNAQIYAMAEKGNSAYEKLRMFCNGFVADNGFHLNGDFKNYGYTTFHYRPFTLESSFGFCDALQEMLLQEHQGYLHLFPAIPDDWKGETVAFKNLRSYGGVLVSAKCVSGKVTEAELCVPKDCVVKIKNVFDGGRVTLNGVELSAQDGYFVVNAKKGVLRFSAK